MFLKHLATSIKLFRDPVGVGTLGLKNSDLEKTQGHFACYGRIKANSRDKNLHVTIINTKAGLPNCQIGLQLNSSFLYNHHLGDAINFDYVLLPLHF